LINLPLNEIIGVTGGQLRHGSGNPVVSHVITESLKEIEDGTLVFHLDRDPIRGVYWEKNRSIVIITDEPEQCTDLGEHVVLIESADILEAYWNFVHYYRSLIRIPVIGVTGTCGKTTTKEMIKHILKKDSKVKATWMSLNSKSHNLRYLLGIDENTGAAVFEMPVVYPGYLRTSCDYFKPQIRILLNIGVHHLADSETPEAYMKAKAEIMHGMDPEHDTLILNADDENIRRYVDASHLQRVVYIGKSSHSDFRIGFIAYDEDGMTFQFEHEGQSYEAFVPGYGEHNVYNALASIAAASHAGVDIPTCVIRIADFQQVEEHMEFKRGNNGCTVIDDTWNSSSMSTITGLQVLQDVSMGKTSIALLGYIPQLGEGPYADYEYALLGEKAAAANVDLLIAVGPEAAGIGERAIEVGMDTAKVRFCENGAEIYKVLQPYFNENTVILLEITHRVMTQPSFAALKQKLIPED
jgi:UDP-N-acetylmuramoyl-tripeptide--D-alanyl-D-alanine ligase